MLRKNLFVISALLLSTVSAQAASRTACHLPADQGRGSLLGSWSALPIKIAFDPEFTPVQVAALQNAVATWNGWAGLRGMKAFEIGVSVFPFPDLSQSCSQAAYTEYSPSVVTVWKIGKSGANANHRASCGSVGKLMQDGVREQTDWILENGKIKSASVLLNFDTAFGGADQKVDLESSFLHGLGNVLGLLGSCNGSTGNNVDSTSAPMCNIAPEAYTKAVMAPYLGAYEIRRQLTENDYNRVNCLY